MEFAMRIITAASLVAICGIMTGAPARGAGGRAPIGGKMRGPAARADWVPPFKANDTGGIIAFDMATQGDARQLAVDHCAYYGKVVKFLAIDPHPGGYISFARRGGPAAGSDQR